ncbi:TPA: hypothetical protein ROX98_002228 [Bacillus pseudomycoides]|nr:hypothetical protein [Bacillus pseudomycoides]
MKIDYENATVADYLELQNKLKQGGEITFVRTDSNHLFSSNTWIWK